MKNDKNREFIRTLHGMIADFLRDNPDVDNSYYQGIQDLLESQMESDDERIRKKMVEHFKNKTKKTWCNIPVEDIISYLEKQKELKSGNPFSGVGFDYNGHHYGMCARDNGVEVIKDRVIIYRSVPPFIGQNPMTEETLRKKVDACMGALSKIAFALYKSECEGNNPVEQIRTIVTDTAVEIMEINEEQKEQKDLEKSKVPVEPADTYADEIVKWEDAHPDWDKDRMRATALHFFKQRLQAEWSEDGKKSFVDSGFLWCVSSFEDFKAGETYWLEYLSNDNYSVRSDNLLARTYHITPEQLYSHFKKYIVQKLYVPYDPQNWPADQDNLTQDQKLVDMVKPMSWGKELEDKMYEACKRHRAPNTDPNKYSDSALFYAGVLAERELNAKRKLTKHDKRILKGIIGFLDHDQHYGVSNKEMVEWLKKTFSEFA